MKNSQSGRTESASHQKANKHKAIICSIQISLSSCEVLQHSWGATVSLPRSPKHLIVISRKWWAVCFGTLETPLKDSSWVSKRADALTNNSERQWGQKRIAFFLPWSMSHHISLVYKNHANYHFLEQSLLFQKHI